MGTATSLVIWQLHPAEIGARHDLDLLLLISVVVFWGVLNSMVPPLSYFTTLDWYMILNFLSLVAVSISHIAVPYMRVGWLKEAFSPLSLSSDTMDEESQLLV